MPVPSLAQLAADAILDRCTSDYGLEEELEQMAAEGREGPGLGSFVLELLRRHANLEYLISTNSLFVYEEMNRRVAVNGDEEVRSELRSIKSGSIKSPWTRESKDVRYLKMGRYIAVSILYDADWSSEKFSINSSIIHQALLREYILSTADHYSESEAQVLIDSRYALLGRYAHLLES
jgi:hypothetical protein